METNQTVEETIKIALSFLESVKQKDKIAIIHGHDCDSICSAAIFYKLIKNLKAKAELVISELNSSLQEGSLKKIKNIKPTHTIILDIPDVGVNVLTELRNLSKVMIVDHHIPKGYAKITYVNPRLYDRNIYLPTTYLSYKIYENFFDSKEIAWIAGIGTLADIGMKNCEDLFKKIKDNHQELVDELELNDNILLDNSLLGELTKVIESAGIIKNKEGSVFALQNLIDSKNYKEILKNKKLMEYFNLTEKEFKRAVEGFKKNKKTVNNILLYEIKPKFKLKSPLANYMQRFFDDKIIVVYQKEDKTFNISLREGNSLQLDLAKIARESVRDIPDSNGGGHPQAAGVRIPVKYLNKFIENLKELKTELERKKR